MAILTPRQAAELDAVREIFREYAANLNIKLCFQGLEQDLATLPGDYAAPRGALLLALVDGQVAGCCALRPLDSADFPNACEMKAARALHLDLGFLEVPPTTTTHRWRPLLDGHPF